MSAIVRGIQVPLYESQKRIMFSSNFAENFLTAYPTPFSLHARCDFLSNNEYLPQHHRSLKDAFSKVVFYFIKSSFILVVNVCE